MIIRNSNSLIETFRANDKAAFMRFTSTGGSFTLSVQTNWAHYPVTPADDSSLHTLFQTVLPTTAPSSHHAIHVMGAANEVARRSRRGVGNLIVASDAIMQHLKALMPKSMYTLFVDNTIASDEAIVIYKGFYRDLCVDGPFSYNGTDLKMHPDWYDYVQRVKFV